jgi:hypothetical protein
MAKPNSVRDTKRLCADSRDLIDQSAAMILESGAACAGFMDQIKKTKEAVTKSRKQISRLRRKRR